MTLEQLNHLPWVAASATFERCCGARVWVERMCEARPFADRAALRERFASTAAWAGEEQSAAARASEQTLAALAAGNRAYEEKFGYIFVVCATGKSADQMLALLEARLGNEPGEELRVAAGEQMKITRLRLEKLLGDS